MTTIPAQCQLAARKTYDIFVEEANRRQKTRAELTALLGMVVPEGHIVPHMDLEDVICQSIKIMIARSLMAADRDNNSWRNFNFSNMVKFIKRMTGIGIDDAIKEAVEMALEENAPSSFDKIADRLDAINWGHVSAIAPKTTEGLRREMMNLEVSDELADIIGDHNCRTGRDIIIPLFLHTDIVMDGPVIGSLFRLRRIFHCFDVVSDFTQTVLPPLELEDGQPFTRDSLEKIDTYHGKSCIRLTPDHPTYKAVMAMLSHYRAHGPTT